MIEFRFDVFNIRLTQKNKSSAGEPTWGGKESQRAAQSHFGPGTLFGIELERDPIGYYNFFLVMSLHANKFAEREEKKRGGGVT